MKVELHLLQNFPPSNLNRDDTGQPKDTDFGGVRRARVSSQCIKRSIRRSGPFERRFADRIATRTKRVQAELAPRLIAMGHAEEEALALSMAVLDDLLSWDAEREETKVLFYVGPEELDRLAELAHEHSEAISAAVHARRALPDDSKDKAEKKAIETADTAVGNAARKVGEAFRAERQGRVRSVDVALFGRMLAQVPGMNIDAASQVAHAVSTHALDQDFDFYTAVDDLKAADDTAEDKGAGMVGTTGFNSSCYYRYALVDAEKLAANLAEGAGGVTAADRRLAADVIAAFVEGAVEAIPTGKQNAFAAQTPPALVMAVVRNGGSAPWSLANAFALPVEPGGEGIVAESVKRLDRHWDALVDMYGDGGAQVFIKVAKDVGGLDTLTPHAVANVPAIVQGVADALQAWAEA
jgi:CRISPR system Cascade subunit CasC